MNREWGLDMFGSPVNAGDFVLDYDFSASGPIPVVIDHVVQPEEDAVITEEEDPIKNCDIVLSIPGYPEGTGVKSNTRNVQVVSESQLVNFLQRNYYTENTGLKLEALRQKVLKNAAPTVDSK